MEPALTIIGKFGGRKAVTKIIGVSYGTVCKWAWSKERGGTDGFIPWPHALKLMAYAEKNGIEIEHADFFPTNEQAAAQ